MKNIYRLIYNYKVWSCLRTGVTKRKILQLVLFSYKYKIYPNTGLCNHLIDVEIDLHLPHQHSGFKQFNGFSEPEHKGDFWWPVDDRKSRIEFLKDLISKQD